MPRQLTRGEKNIRWIERNCLIPDGRDIGKPVKLRDWQKEQIKRIYDNPMGTRRAIISFGRKNAKSTLAAFILLLHFCGREAKPNSQLYSAAQSRDQAGLIFSIAAKIVRMVPKLRDAVHVRDTAKQLYCPELGTLYRALSAEVATAYGLSPALVIHDELGQVRGPRSELYDALETATGAQAEPLSIIISTQAANDGDLLSMLIDDAARGDDPRVILSLYTAPMGADPFAEETIKAANPAFGDFLNAREVLAMAADAKRMPSRENEYRNLVLNQRVEVYSHFVSHGVWMACGGKPEPLTGQPVFAGLDLSAVSDLTAFVMIAKVGGQWQVHPVFWLPKEGLAEKARTDHAPYDLWDSQGHLIATPGKVIDYDYVADQIKKFCGIYDIRKIAFDPWNWGYFKPSLLRVGFTERVLEQKFVEFRQGMKTMAPAVKELSRALIDGRIAHGMHPVLSSCAGNAVVQMDAAGGMKLDKAKSTGRIDGLVALAMAIGAVPKEAVAPTHKVYFI